MMQDFNIQDSRTIASLGEEEALSIKDKRVLIMGCLGVGVETAKHLILNQAAYVYLHDSTKVEDSDKILNFFYDNIYNPN